MLPSKDIGRGYHLYEGSQIGQEPIGFYNPMGVLLITITYEVFTPGSTGSFRKDNGMRLAGVATIALALTHPMLPT